MKDLEKSHATQLENEYIEVFGMGHRLLIEF